MLTLSSCINLCGFMQTPENYLHHTVNIQDFWLGEDTRP